MKHHTVIVEIEVEVLAKRPQDVNRIIRESTFRVDRAVAKTPGGLHVLRVLRHSHHHEDGPGKR